MKRIRKEELIAVLQRHGFNLSKVADELQISRQTLYNKMLKMNLKMIIRMDCQRRGMRKVSA